MIIIHIIIPTKVPKPCNPAPTMIIIHIIIQEFSSTGQSDMFMMALPQFAPNHSSQVLFSSLAEQQPIIRAATRRANPVTLKKRVKHSMQQLACRPLFGEVLEDREK